MANEQSHTVSNSGCDYLEVGFSQYHHTPPRMITLEEFTNSVKVGNGTEVFTSAYRYVSTDPYSGPITSNFYLDFDFEKDPDLARREALKVARWFNDIGIPEVGIRIVFSGCKGFWIFISKHFFNASPREDLPEVWERLARILKEYFKLTTLDFQPYFRRAMIRVNSS
ncbi:MAG: hypothetical protein JRN67_13815, partial [Nitrososphaerota archaeon]|nr:hypothetical protein [Nitrososphaerota archaeon]